MSESWEAECSVVRDDGFFFAVTDDDFAFEMLVPDFFSLKNSLMFDLDGSIFSSSNLLCRTEIYIPRFKCTNRIYSKEI